MERRMHMKEWTAKVATIVVILSTPGALRSASVDDDFAYSPGHSSGPAGTPLPSSVVFLYRQKTHEVRTHITNASGQYRFSGLDFMGTPRSTPSKGAGLR